MCGDGYRSPKDPSPPRAKPLMICWLMKSLLSQVAIYRHLFPLPDAKAAYLYPASFILYTPGSKADNVFCSRTQHNDPAGNCTPNFGSGVHTTAPGPPRFPRTRRTNNYTRPVCSLDKHRKLLVQSRSKHILHHWSILRWDLSSTHLKRNWK